MTRKHRCESKSSQQYRNYVETAAQQDDNSFKPYVPFFPTPIPITKNHQKYHAVCKDKTKKIILCKGWAGTSKTITMCYYAAKALLNEDIDEIVICRSLEGVGQNPGAYKGDMFDKNAPKLKGVMNYISSFMGIDIGTLIAHHKVTVQGLFDIQGMDFTGKWLLVTECQTLTPEQMYQIVTRGAEKIILEGDTVPAQLTNKSITKGHDGLSFLMNTIGDLPFVSEISMCEEEDIVRQPYLKQVITRMMPALEQYERR